MSTPQTANTETENIADEEPQSPQGIQLLNEQSSAGSCCGGSCHG